MSGIYYFAAHTWRHQMKARN